jgi:hypothetical protein
LQLETVQCGGMQVVAAAGCGCNGSDESFSIPSKGNRLIQRTLLLNIFLRRFWRKINLVIE